MTKTEQLQPDWLIQTEDLTKVYQMGDVSLKALDGIDLKITSGEFVALMGSSGSGKSTLLHLLGCLDTPTSGKYLLEGQNVSGLSVEERARIRNKRIGFVFQNFNLLPRASALENVMLPLTYRKQQSDAIIIAQETLALMGLADRMAHVPNELSGGERQRVAIARALVTDPAMILADEPTGNLDSVTSNEIMQSLLELNQRGRTVLVVTHDANIAAHAQRILHMQDGRFINGDPNGRA